MRIVVVADTHIPDRYNELPCVLIDEFKNADLIIHAGDFTSLETYKKIESTKKLKAVLGNMDALELQKILKTKEVFTIKQYKIGIFHGLGKPQNVLDSVRKSFDGSFDIVIYGHTHNPHQVKIGKTLFFNPGSPTDKIFAEFNSYGIIEINKTVEAKIIQI